jgi:signal transduction histidine kinase/ActR/RegA family two-component response regulator
LSANSAQKSTPPKSHTGRSISRDLTIGIILTVAAVSTVMISISFFNASYNARIHLESKADDLIAAISELLKFPLWNFDEETVKGIGASYAYSDLVANLKIIDSLGSVYFEEVKNFEPPLIVRSRVVLNKDNPVGRVEIALTSQHYKEISQQFIWSSIFVILINLFSLIVMTRFLIRRFLQQPINHFSEIVSSYSSKNYNLPPDYTTIVEFAPAIQVLNEMGAKISSQMAELQQARDELEMRVTERTIELAQANKDLQIEIAERRQAEEERMKLALQLQRAQKMEAIGTLAGGVAHDLNNILSGIVSYPELLLLDLPQNSPLAKPIHTIKKSGEKATAIVQDLLTLARRGVPAKEIVDLNHIIADYLKSPEFANLQLFQPNIHVATHFEADLLNIMGSSIHLTKTVMNLMSNAFEAIPQRGKTTITTQNRYIDQPIKGYDEVQEGDYAVLTIADDGIGISPSDIERIFEPFYTKKVMGKSGTGLGMAVVWGTVKDHRGYINVQSHEGNGTVFTLYFPATRKTAATADAALSFKEYLGCGEHILVVDDVAVQRDISTKMLETLGYSTSSAASGEAAVEYMRNNFADLIVLDMIMDPGMNGRETYEQILKLHPGQKAIIASGFSETDEVRAVIKLGASRYIRKPYTLEKIGLAVRHALEIDRSAAI